MGTVFEAVDADGQAVAVKTLTTHLSDDEGMRRRFEAEIEALKGLRHPGIVRLLAFGQDEGRPFFAMELVRGHSLEEMLKAGRRFSWQETVAIAGEITRALKVAHDQGIVHRDLKPANLLFPEQTGVEGSVRLADFGIARLFGDAGHTLAGTVVGTAEYMAPEQAAGSVADHRADLYSLGLVMFAMLTGSPPFRGGKVSEVLQRQRRETPPRVSVIRPEIPASLDALIERLLAKNASDRPASALAVGRALDAIGADEKGTPPASPSGPTVAIRSSDATQAGPVRSDGTDPQLKSIDLLAATRVTSTGDPAGKTTPGSSPRVDGNAATQAFKPGTVAGTGESSPSRSLAHRVTEPDSVGPGGVPTGGSRFTTVESLERTLREQARRAARRDGIIRLIVALGLLAMVAAGGYLALQPVTADQLHARIMATARNPAADLRDAHQAIEMFLRRFPEDERAAAIRRLDHQLDVDALERRTRRRTRDDTALSPLERDYRAAMAREEESPLACLAALEAILALHADAVDAPAANDGDDDPALWLALVQRQIERIEPAARREQDEDVDRAEATLAEAKSLAEQAADADPAEQEALLGRRRELLEGLIEIYRDRPHVAAAVTEARRLLAAGL
jgi:serine/threonine protein kinase